MLFYSSLCEQKGIFCQERIWNCGRAKKEIPINRLTVTNLIEQKDLKCPPLRNSTPGIRLSQAGRISQRPA